MFLRGLQECLDEAGHSLEEVQLFAADTGPGSFIGTRVAVTLAKTLAFANGKQCLASSAFDLMDRDLPVVIPNRKHEWFLRIPGKAVEILRYEHGSGHMLEKGFPEEFVAYGMDDDRYPHAAQFRHLPMEPMSPEMLIPTYLVEPSISIPKTPYAEASK